MDEEIERLVVSVRADTQGFASDVAAMREELDGPLGDSVGRAGALIENALSRAVRTGKLGFEDLRQVAARAMAEIARSAVGGGIGNLSGGSPGGDLVSGLGSLVTALGLAGRATGGPGSPGQAYLVGESGTERFVPTSSGQLATGGGSPGREGGGGRHVSGGEGG